MLGMLPFALTAALHSASPIVIRIPPGPISGRLPTPLGVGPNRPVVFKFLRGFHQVTSTLEITESNIRLEGESGAVLGGGPMAKGWKPVTDSEILARLPDAAARSNVRELDLGKIGITSPAEFTQRGFGLPEGLSHTELLVDGIPLTPARYPHAGAPGAAAGWLLTGSPVDKHSFKLDDERPKAWKNVGHVWAYGYWKFDWADSWEAVKSVSDGAVRLQEQPGGPIPAFGLGKGKRFFFSNVLEELDEPGEYWTDFDHDRLIAWLPKSKSGDIVVSDLGGPLIHASNCSNVVIKGLTLEATRGQAIRIEDCSNSIVDHCVIRNAGASGVVVTGGHACGVRDCDITQTGDSGVSLSGGDRKTLTRGDHFVEGCTITRISRWARTYHPAVNLEGVGQRVSGNAIFDLPHQAILFTGNDHIIERNDFRRVCMETGDAGAIYTGRDTTTRGTVIRWNRFREIEPHVISPDGGYTGVMSVYLDDCQAGISVIGNIFESKGTAIMLGGGRDNIIEGNVFLGCQPAISFDMRARGWAKSYFHDGWEWKERIKAMPILESPWREHYPKLYAEIRDGVDLSYAGGNFVHGNFNAGGKWIVYLDGLNVKDLDYANNELREQPASLSDGLKAVARLYDRIPIATIGNR